ncbi:hypothetical protein JCM19240_5335 [Vibrio maritimus]|uniref:Uncharacterized protein n=1 Tax=Vibrio maritimus TaxID=990268 RepID=A0A090SZN5_9VIBR|nr:hypothetical protein JCM19240_5335 [Vibrio maritimus]
MLALVRGLFARELIYLVLALFVIHKTPLRKFIHSSMTSAADPTFVFTGGAAWSDDNNFLGHEQQSQLGLKNKAPIIH